MRATVDAEGVELHDCPLPGSPVNAQPRHTRDAPTRAPVRTPLPRQRTSKRSCPRGSALKQPCEPTALSSGGGPPEQGGYRACSRLGIDCSRSPFLKISFETAAAFLTDATLHGASDDLASPASRIVLGRVVEARGPALARAREAFWAADCRPRQGLQYS